MSLRLVQTPDENGQPIVDVEGVLEALHYKGRREIMARRDARLEAAQQGRVAALAGGGSEQPPEG